MRDLQNQVLAPSGGAARCSYSARGGTIQACLAVLRRSSSVAPYTLRIRRWLARSRIAASLYSAVF